METEAEKQPVSDAAPADEIPVVPRAVPAPSKTPFFESSNALRYQRQALIKTIEDLTEHPLICYVAGIDAPIDRDDTIGFVDLLHNVQPGRALDFLLHTPGGNTDAADKLISMVRKKAGSAQLRIIVPDYAKSAGTMMVLAADTVVMSDSSELGPIDPQVIRWDGNNRYADSVISYLEAFETHSETLRHEPDNVAARIMLNKLDPSRLKSFEAMKARARKGAEDLLRDGMFKNSGNQTRTVSALLGESKVFLTHGQPIYWRDAKDERIGLNVTYLPSSSAEWQKYWQLYCLQRLAITERQKLYESNYVTLVVDSPTY